MNKLVLAMTMLFLTGLLGVAAYNTGFTGGDPTTFGHSSDEVQVNYQNSPQNLQATIDALNTRIQTLENQEPPAPIDPDSLTNCDWKEMEDALCNAAGNCRARIKLETAIEEGATGACYFKRSNGNYYSGVLHSIVIGTSPSATELFCQDFSGSNTNVNDFNQNNPAMYYACN